MHAGFSRWRVKSSRGVSRRESRGLGGRGNPGVQQSGGAWEMEGKGSCTCRGQRRQGSVKLAGLDAGASGSRASGGGGKKRGVAWKQGSVKRLLRARMSESRIRNCRCGIERKGFRVVWFVF